MNLKDLMSGIAVVIDDALEPAATGSTDNDDSRDLIVRIVERLEREWSLPLYKSTAMPPTETWPNLLRSASFILLDWNLWPSGSSQLERDGKRESVRFLAQARDHLVPVFIFTNENRVDVADQLPDDIYRIDSPDKSFVFIQGKDELLLGDSLDLSAVQEWMMKNASVYALKMWDQVFRDARRDLFSSMYTKSPDWPRVFWRAYEQDGVDPSLSLTHMITDSLQGRVRTNAFEAEMLANTGTVDARVPRKDLRELISATIFRRVSPDDEIRCGDLFRQPGGKYLLNIRPDCDCIPRQGAEPDKVDLYCIKGRKMRQSELEGDYDNGRFRERDDQGIVFAAVDGRSIRFKFKELRVEKFGALKSDRIGRLLHPFVTRIQQRYALFLQRQGLPRIPREAVIPKGDGQED